MEMARWREFSTLSLKENMNIWKINLNSRPAPAPKHTLFLSAPIFHILSILIYLQTPSDCADRFVGLFCIDLLLNQF